MTEPEDNEEMQPFEDSFESPPDVVEEPGRVEGESAPIAPPSVGGVSAFAPTESVLSVEEFARTLGRHGRAFQAWAKDREPKRRTIKQWRQALAEHMSRPVK